MVNENRKTPDRNHQELHSETVVVSIVGGPELRVDQVYGGICATDVDQLVNSKEQPVTGVFWEKW